jgi:hypothetical protein
MIKKGECENDPKHRNKSSSDVISCEGRMEGYFQKDMYWFKTKHCHTCNKGRGGTTRMHADHQPKIQMTPLAPLRNIAFKNRRRMRAVLEECLDGWWEIFPKQGPSRRWLKGINEIGNMV